MTAPELPSSRPTRGLAFVAAVLILVACAESAERDDVATTPAADLPSPTVTILEPTDGAQVEGPDVLVRFEVAGVRIVPAGDTTAGSGHHHLYLDHDLTDPTQPVPTIPGAVVHVGTGATEVLLEGVAPGEHRLIAVVGDGLHVPLQPWVVDTVRFVVR